VYALQWNSTNNNDMLHHHELNTNQKAPLEIDHRRNITPSEILHQLNISQPGAEYHRNITQPGIGHR